MTEKTLVMAVCGDINIQGREHPAKAFRLVEDRLAVADVRLANLEMCLSGADDALDVKRPVTDRPPWMQSDPSMVEALTSVDLSAVTTANNVTSGETTIRSSLRVLDDHGILHTGSGANRADAHLPAVLQADDGTRIGLLGYTCPTYPKGHVANETDAGVAAVRCLTAYQPNHRVLEMPGVSPVVRTWPEPEDLAVMEAEVRALRDEVDVLVVYFHMGVSLREDLAEYQTIVARAAVHAGADAVFGASAHVPQAIEVYQGVPIFYGMGNFAFDWWFMEAHRTGLFVECDIRGGRIQDARVFPVTRTLNEENLVQILSADDASGGRQIIDRVIDLSQPFGTTFEHAGDYIRLNGLGA